LPKKKKKRIDPVTRKVRSIRSSLRKYGIRDISTEEVRKMVGEVQTCAYCQEPVAVKNLSVDHKQPRSRGGADAKENIWLICVSCNYMKGALTHEEFSGLMDYLRDKPEVYRNLRARLKAGGSVLRGMY
jgi:5-methylcytosine-specific restriction endonuclease McrA